MTGNPPQNPPFDPPGTGWYARYARWWQAHVLHRLPLGKRRRIVNYAKASLSYAGRMHYTETAQRSELFHRPKGKFLGAHADCSQYSASLCHWVGVQGVTETDWTGTLCRKGIKLAAPEPGAFVFFGTAPFVHMGVMRDRTHVIGFGQQAAPNMNTLSALLAYFAQKGHPGYEFRDLTTVT